jgi:hypothetical protein
VTPQAVTKWLKGGAVEVEKLARLAEWSGYSFQSLRRLVDDQKLRVMPNLTHSSTTSRLLSDELNQVWDRLTDDHRQQLLGMAKGLASRQGRRRPGDKK